MMNSENQGLESLNRTNSCSDYRSATSSSLLSDNHHPLSPSIAAESTQSDPLISPLHDPSLESAYYSSRPFNGNSVNEINGSDSLSPSSSSSSSSSYFIKITVSNPQKEQETSNSLVPGGGSYVTYLITTRTNLPDFNGSEFRVRRRFRDVVALSDRLAESYRGFIIPPRPDKNVVESQVMQKQDFVEHRRVALEKYLRRLMMHPVIRKSDVLKAFLTEQGNLPLPTTPDTASRMVDSVMEQPTKGGKDLWRLFKELKQSVTNDWGGSRPPVVEDDKDFLEKKDKMKDLELQITNASKQAESLVKAQQDMGDTMGELGLAFVKLTKFENEQAKLNSQRVRAADMKNVATAAIKASRFYRGLNSQTVKHLDTLHDYLGLMLSTHGAVADRSNALLTVQSLTTELSSLHMKAEKLETAASKVFGGDRSRILKLEELKDNIRATENAKSTAVREYEQIKENNWGELERIDRERRADFLNMLKGFAHNQVEYAEKIAAVWNKAVEETSGYAKESS